MIWLSLAALAISTWTLVFLWRSGRRHQRTMAALSETYRRLEDEPQWLQTMTTTYSPPWPENDPDPCIVCGDHGEVELIDSGGNPVGTKACPNCTEDRR